MILEKERRNCDDLVYLLGDLKDKKALAAIVHSKANWDIKQPAVYKITAKKFKNENELRSWYEQQS